MPIVSNQQKVASLMRDLGLIDISSTIEELALKFSKFRGEMYPKLKMSAEISLKYMDGLGVERICRELNK